ncbi:GAF domain-containing sensor histidine kinase [Pseudoxanthomonas daejeonensis]|nr:GAF domain-containing sensor histidine kinase [Pseudoxanthomonas daejeonensis]
MEVEPGRVGDAATTRTVGADLLALGALVTGMECVLAAEVTPSAWRAVAVHGQCRLGVRAGSALDPALTFCNEVRARGEPVYFGNAGLEARFRDSPLVREHGIHSHVAVPLRTRDGRLFGTLCAFDAQPRPVSAAMVEGMQRLARLFGALLDDTSDRLSASVELTDSALRLTQSRLALAESRQELFDAQAVAKLREEFIAVLAHDLRNPLQAIRMATEMFGMAALPAAQERLVSHLHRSAERMSELIETTMDFARGRLAGGIALDVRPCATLQAHLAGVVDEVRQGHPGRRVLAVLDIDHAVECDESRLGQMLSNLLINALVHGSTETTIQVMAVTTDTTLRISVANRGVIPVDEVGRIFEPFERPADRRLAPGLGLGLYIASQIAVAHGGELRVFSSEAADTLFEFSLPLKAGAH